jgi:hypothetical protein
MISDEHRLWQAGDLECVMISCCTGAELQVRRLSKTRQLTGADADILLREMYPTKNDLYERARDLQAEYANR